MTEQHNAYGDPTTQPFWEAASRHELVVQHCMDCDHHQFYPRPFCLNCESNNLRWQPVSGDATIYTMTTVHVQVAPQFDPPYVAAVVELDQGPRMLTHIDGGEAHIGDRVKLTWRQRDDAPPLPVWIPA